MKTTLVTVIGGAVIALTSLTTAMGDPAKAPSRVKPTREQAAQALPIYVPPLRGAPASRVGGASRGLTEASVTLSVLAPHHTGLTTREQPSLYWYLSKPVAARLELTLIDDQAINPLAEIQLSAPDTPGIQHVDLSKHDIKLKPGVEYRWFVALVPDPKQRSNDILAGGTIKRIEPSASLRAKLAHTSGDQLTYVYAEEGIWYDAIATVSGLIEDAPGNANLKAQRATLLEQVGLAKIAAEDMNAAR
ncbi:MAG: DUF928 domain-containing protein [Gammaproteobacteria bacterium]